MSSETVADSIAKEASQKRKRLAASIWPRARLVGEIFWRQVEGDQVFTQASALTYKTLFSLLPIFVLSLLVLSMLSSGDGTNKLESTVREMIFKQAGIDSLTHVGGAGGVAATQATTAPATQGGTPDLERSVDHFVRKAKESVTNKSTGLVAFAVLLYGAISLMIVIEGTFNQIFGVVRARTWLRRLMLYWCVLTLGPLMVAASIVLGNSALSAASSVATAAPLVTLARALSGFMVSWLLIMLLYRLVPDTKVKWRAAAVGAFVAALAWETGKWGFGLYVQTAAKSSWYGSMALLPLFMLWIYITWSVVLMGLEITYVLQFWGLLKRRFLFSRATPPGAPVISDMKWVLNLGVLIYRDFRAGRMTEVQGAAEALMLPNEVVFVLLEALEKAGLVHEARTGAYVLARPAEGVTAHDLLTAARALCEVPAELSGDRRGVQAPGVTKLEEMETGWAKGQALPALAGE